MVILYTVRKLLKCRKEIGKCLADQPNSVTMSSVKAEDPLPALKR